MKNYRYYVRDLTLEMDRERCIGCGMCVEVCPHGVFGIEQGKAVLLDRDGCMECGACSRNCPTAAVRAGSGVGCASAIIGGLLRGSEPECGCCCGDQEDGEPQNGACC